MILACAHAGFRSGTAAALTPREVQDGYIVVSTKRGARTQTPVTPALRACLDLALDPDRTYLNQLSERDWRNSRTEIAKRWRAWKVKCGVRKELRFHDLRRGLARRLYKQTGGDLRAVQALLSHTQLSSTLHYLAVHNKRVTADTLALAINGKDTD